MCISSLFSTLGSIIISSKIKAVALKIHPCKEFGFMPGIFNSGSLLIYSNMIVWVFGFHCPYRGGNCSLACWFGNRNLFFEKTKYNYDLFQLLNPFNPNFLLRLPFSSCVARE